MKIKHLTESKQIIEAEEKKAETASTDKKDLADINPQQASTAEVASAAKASIEKQTEGEETITKEEATKLANEIKQTADEVNAGGAEIIPNKDTDEYFITENRLSHTLDRALANARKFKRQGLRAGANVLVSGLPGSGKTAIVEDWCVKRGVKYVKINAKNNKLETAIDGMPMRVQGTNEVAFLPTDLLKPLLEKECVLFLDEYNRQTNPQIRGALLTLINEKRTADDKQDFSKTLLFTVACINPSIKTDKGAAPLNDAERSRFIYNLADFDSDRETASNYFTVVAANRLKKLGVTLPGNFIKELKKKSSINDPTKGMTPEQIDQHYKTIDAEEELKIWHLSDFITHHPDFEFDSRDDLVDLYDNQKNLLNQRLLTDAIRISGGDAKEFLDWVENSSNLLEKDKDMFRNILSTYSLDLRALKAQFGLAPNENIGSTDATAEPEESGEVYDELDDDADLFSGNAAGKTNVSAADAEQKIQDFINSF